MKSPILSVCINTRNRAGFLSETLDSILVQLNESVEVVVVDGASDDGTEPMMRDYASRHAAVHYFRSETPIGIDEGYDMAVAQAKGRYCWMMTDDDLADDGALDRLLAEIEKRYDLILLEIDCYTKDLSVSLHQSLYQVGSDRVFTPENFQDFWPASGKGLSYIGSVVLRRSIWFEHDRTQYYGSYFVHVGIILESTAITRALIVGHPYIKYRSGNSSWTPRSFEIWNFKWPLLVWDSTRLSTNSKEGIVPREPWRRALSVLKSRAMGEYDFKTFKTWLVSRLAWERRIPFLLIALIPRTSLNFMLLLFCLIFRKSNPYTIYNLAVSSSYPRMAVSISALLGVRFSPASGAE
jgi:abequosyltransferase